MITRWSLRLALWLLTPMVAVAGCSSPSAPAATIRAAGPSGNVCVNGARFAPTFDQEFKDNSWRITKGGHWSTRYPWGRSNPGAKDGAHYADLDEGLGFNPFAIVNGNTLAIEARPAPVEIQPKIDSLYLSGMISTAGEGAPAFAQRFGYYEVRAQLPKGRGLWPSFWMLDSQGGRAEIDVFELLGHDLSTLYQSVHRVDGTGDSYPYHPSFDPTAGYHTYGVLVTPLKDTYFVDGTATHDIPDASTGPFYFMVSLQIGDPDSWPGAPNQTTQWPAHLYVQYFRAYASADGSC